MKWDCKLSNGSFSNLLEVCVFYLKELALRALVVRQHLVSVYVSLFLYFCVLTQLPIVKSRETQELFSPRSLKSLLPFISYFSMLQLWSVPEIKRCRKNIRNGFTGKSRWQYNDWRLSSPYPFTMVETELQLPSMGETKDLENALSLVT